MLHGLKKNWDSSLYSLFYAASREQDPRAPAEVSERIVAYVFLSAFFSSRVKMKTAASWQKMAFLLSQEEDLVSENTSKHSPKLKVSSKSCYSIRDSMENYIQIGILLMRYTQLCATGGFFFWFGGILGQPQGTNFPSPWATMLALRLDCSTVALNTPQKVLPFWKLVELNMLDFSDRRRTGISILTSAAD